MDDVHVTYNVQQDSALSNLCRSSKDSLTENTNQLVKKDVRLSLSTDCNPMDYPIWDMPSKKTDLQNQN